MIEVDDDQREADAVLAIAGQVIGFAVLGASVAAAVVVGAVVAVRAGWRKLQRARGW